MRLSLILMLCFSSSCALILDTDLKSGGSGPSQPGFSGARSGGGGASSKPSRTNSSNAVQMAASLSVFLDEESEGFVGLCDKKDCQRYQFENLIVTSPEFVVQKDKQTGAPKLKGIYVADPTMVDQEGRQIEFSGIKVVFFADQMEGPEIGSSLSFTALAKSFYGESQLSRLQDIQTSKSKKTVSPALFDGSLGREHDSHPSKLSSVRKGKQIGEEAVEKVTGGDLSAAFEGVLVTLKNVETIEVCSPQPYPFKNPNVLRDFGNFRVTGGVEIGNEFTKEFVGNYPKAHFESTCSNREARCNDSRALEQVFSGITGIYQRKYDQHQLEPRGREDFDPPEVFVDELREECGAE